MIPTDDARSDWSIGFDRAPPSVLLPDSAASISPNLLRMDDSVGSMTSDEEYSQVHRDKNNLDSSVSTQGME